MESVTCRQFWDTLVWSMLMTSLTSVPALVLLDMSWDRCMKVLLHRTLVLLYNSHILHDVLCKQKLRDVSLSV